MKFSIALVYSVLVAYDNIDSAVSRPDNRVLSSKKSAKSPKAKKSNKGHGHSADSDDVEPDIPDNEADTSSLDIAGRDCPVFTENPSGNTNLQQRMLDAAKPCGHYQSKGCPYTVISANVDYPGEGPGDLDYVPYIVQFDIGVHSRIKNTVMGYHQNWDGGDEKRDCIGCDEAGETCLELIVKGGSDATGGCAGKCGSGCDVFAGGYAYDCLKHDVCTTYKALFQRNSIDFDQADGYCRDPDCGDEAAQSVFNCYIDYTFNDVSIICSEQSFAADPDVYGHWSYTTSLPSLTFDEGPCNHFTGWASGQGLPNRDQIRNPYRFRRYLKSKEIDISLAG